MIIKDSPWLASFDEICLIHPAIVMQGKITCLAVQSQVELLLHEGTAYSFVCLRIKNETGYYICGLKHTSKLLLWSCTSVGGNSYCWPSL